MSIAMLYITGQLPWDVLFWAIVLIQMGTFLIPRFCRGSLTAKGKRWLSRPLGVQLIYECIMMITCAILIGILGKWGFWLSVLLLIIKVKMEFTRGTTVSLWYHLMILLVFWSGLCGLLYGTFGVG